MSGYYSPIGTSIAPATVANTLTVANQAARLALVYGTGTGQVQELDQVFQTSDSTLWVLLASDPSVSGNWSRLPGNDASALTTGTLPAARYTSSPTADCVQKYNGSVLVNSGITDSSSTGYVALNGRALDLSNGANPGADIYGIGVMAATLKLQTVTYLASYVGATCYSLLGSAGLAINKGTTAASKALEVVDSAAAQLRLTHTAGTDYADFTVDTDGHLTIDPTGNIVLAGANRATYDASPSATTIRDILISHGLMAAS
jgi:hypothetical protein